MTGVEWQAKWMQQSPKNVERALRDLQRVLGIVNTDPVWVRAISEVKSRYGAFKHESPD